RMRDLSPCAVDDRRDDRVLVGRLDLRPLLELDDDRVVVAVGVPAGEDEVDALGGERNLVLDRYSRVLGNLVTDQDIVHVLPRILPGHTRPRRRGPAHPPLERSENLGLDDVGEDVLGELAAGGRVDDHGSIGGAAMYRARIKPGIEKNVKYSRRRSYAPRVSH